MEDKWLIAVHGGAGVRPTRDYSEVHAHLGQLLDEAAQRLAVGDSALDVAQWAVSDLEACGLYSAGRGSSPNARGEVEFDAAIMDGTTRQAGSVAAIQQVKSPIAAARAVMDKTPHVMLAGDGATLFAHQQALPLIEDPENYFRLPVGVTLEETQSSGDELGHGTVGAVVLDLEGRLAAATSTGGLFGKRPGRVGDSPIIGAGTWADEAIAISCTGVGEYFIRAGGAGDVAAHMRYGGVSPAKAATAMLDRVQAFGGDGGLIAATRDGQAHFHWNSPGLKRAALGSHFPRVVATD